MNDLPIQPQSHVLQDIPCIRCGYNLRTLSTDARCPECSSPVVEALRPDALHHADGRWLRHIRFGIVVFLVALALSTIANCAQFLFGPQLLAYVSANAFWSAMLIWSCIIYCVYCAGLFFVLAGEYSVEPHTRFEQLVQLARRSLFLCAFVFGVAQFLWWEADGSSDKLTFVLPVIEGLVFWAVVVVAILRLQRLAIRSRRLRLATWTSVLLFAAAVRGAIGIALASAVAYNAFFGRVGPMPTLLPLAMGVVIILGVSVAVPILILYIRLLGGASNRIR